MASNNTANVLILVLCLLIIKSNSVNITLIDVYPSGYYYPYSIRPTGDLNQDGFDDFFFTNTYSDIFTIFFGSTFGITSLNSFNTTGISAWTAIMGDFKNDTFPDLMISIFPFETNNQTQIFDMIGNKNSFVLPPPYVLYDNVDEHYGSDMITMDFNNDGFMDAIVGAELATNTIPQEGAIVFHEGSASGLLPASHTIYGESYYSFFGKTLAKGFVNNDTFEDLIVGFQNYSNPELTEGAVYIYYGGPTFNFTQVPTILESNSAGLALGSFVAGGDLDGNGFDDIIATSNSFIHVYYSDGAGSFSLMTYPYSGVISIASGSDVNCDGIDDLIAATQLYIYLFHGTPTRVLQEDIALSMVYSSGFRSVNFIGDIDGDSCTDFASIDPIFSKLYVFRELQPSPSPSPTPSISASSPPWTLTSATPTSSVTSSVTATPSNQVEESSGIDTVAAAAGGAGGGSGCLLIIVVAGVFWFRKKKKKDLESSTSEEEAQAQLELQKPE